MIHPHLSLITTDLSWNDLILDKETMKQVEEIKNWLNHSSSAKPGSILKKKLKPGFRGLFHGPPGTGKKLTAALIGKEFNKPVYKIDLSMVYRSISVKLKRILNHYLPVQKIKTGYYFLMKLMPYLENGLKLKMPMTGMPTRKLLTCCSGWRIIPDL